MRKINLYSNRMQMLARIISLLASIILVVSNIQRLEKFGFTQLIANRYEFFTFITNCISILLFFIVVLYPTKVGIFSILSFMYGSIILILEPENNLGIFMFWLSILTLYARGFYNKKKKLKEIITVFFFCVLILSEVRFGIKVFLGNLLEKIAYTFIYFMSLFFLEIYVLDKLDNLENNKKLDLQNYPELKKRDAQWLADILNGEKYEYLAVTYNMSIGSVKNRIKVIFNVLEVGDKQGFLNKYSDFQICYGDDFSSIKKKKKKKSLFFTI